MLWVLHQADVHSAQQLHPPVTLLAALAVGAAPRELLPIPDQTSQIQQTLAQQPPCALCGTLKLLSSSYSAAPVNPPAIITLHLLERNAQSLQLYNCPL